MLECLFLPEARARAAYEVWRGRVSLDRLEGGSLGLMPLLYFRLRELGLDDDACLPRLRGAHRYHWCRGQVLLRQADAALAVLATERIRPLALKGLAVLDYYGGDHGLRPMSDVDLLVPRKQALAAVEALERRGWTLTPPLAREDLVAALETWHGWTLTLGRAEVDVHWASLVEDTSERGDDGLWRRARARESEGRVLFPSVTDLLFHVCVHGARFSRAGSVMWVPDCMRILRAAADTIDWQALAQEAAARHLQLPVKESLRFLREVLDAPVPAAVLESLSPPDPEWLYWYDYHAHSADPARSTAAHRAAAQIMSKLRRGDPITNLPRNPR